MTNLKIFVLVSCVAIYVFGIYAMSQQVLLTNEQAMCLIEGGRITNLNECAPRE